MRRSGPVPRHRRPVPKGPRRPRRDPRGRTAHGNVREAAVWVLERTLESSAPAETFLEGASSRCDERDHGLLYELVRGTLTWLRRIDHVLAQAAKRDFEQIEPALRGPLRLGAYQLLFLDRVPDHAVVHEAVELAARVTHRGGAGFVNAVLRKVARAPKLEQWPVRDGSPLRQLAIETSHPEFLVERWVQRFGWTATRGILAANNRRKPHHLLSFRDRGGREALAEELIEEGYEVLPSAIAPLGLKCPEGRPWKSEAFRRGRFYVQDEASQVAALLPPPTEGEAVADTAASPGGKTLSLLAHTPSVRCRAADVSLPRLLLMRENLRRLDRSVPLWVADAAEPAVRAAFDRVVLDLPCSGTGTFRKNPELKWRVSLEEIRRLGAEARSLVGPQADLVRPGGLLQIITCSLEAEENEDVATWLLQRRDDFEPEPLERHESLLPAWREQIVGPGFWRIPPGGDHDGFSVTVLRRRSAS